MNRSLSLGLVSGVALGALGFSERGRRQRAERFAAAALETLLRAIDANDSQTGAHVRRVATYSLIIADALGVSGRERRTIELAALFHDIGKIHEALFDIVHEPRKLTPAEKRAIATHPTRGAEVLAPIANFHPWLAEAVLSHHERWNGRGYPRGIRGRKIPLAARIVTLADTFDAVTYHRRYKHGRTAQEAADVILAGRGTQFDPELVDLMLQPPVFIALTRAHRKALLGHKLPRRESPDAERAPKISIRWRTSSQSPRFLERELAASR